MLAGIGGGGIVGIVVVVLVDLAILYFVSVHSLRSTGARRPT